MDASDSDADGRTSQNQFQYDTKGIFYALFRVQAMSFCASL